MLRSILHRRFPLTLHSILNPTINPSSTSNLSSSPSRFPPIFRYFSNSHQNQDETFRDPDAPPRLFVVQPRLRPQTHLKAKLEEALNLANSLEQQRPEFAEAESIDKDMPPHVIVQNPAAKSPRADTYFGRGTVETVKCHLNNLDEDEVDAIFVNATLRGVQQRNLEAAWGKPVLDRVGLIIQIFNAHAQTKEAKLQAELAALVCKRSRLVRVRGPDGRSTFGGVWGSGDIEVVSARGRGSGGRGFISGAGETEIQLQRGRILERKKRLLAEISEVRRTRAMQRSARKRRESLPGQDLPTVAIVGYTNAGKSTLVSKVSNSYLYSDDRLFATVDPKLRSVRLPSGRKVLLSDTVGFISDLPVQLVEAFHATLEEVIEADLLVHVLDSSTSNLDENRESVLHVLRKINVAEEKLQNMIEVWNKHVLDSSTSNLDENRESVLHVLRKINVAEEKLQNMIEVWNKVDLLEEKSEITEPEAGPVDEDADVISGEHDGTEEEEDADVTSGHIECEEEDVCHEINDDPEDWLSVVDEQESRVSYDVSSTTAAVATDKVSEFQPESLQVVKTSAVTGVGLQELLELIDDKLKRIQVVERSSFDRKWRPPRGDEEDSDIAIQQ